MIYLDNAATTQMSPEVLDAMLPYLKDEYGNAGAVYGLGRRAADAVVKARQQVADFVGAKPEQIIFTSSGTEANNLAICGSRHYLEDISKKHIITSPTEHDSVLRAVNALCKPLSPNEKKCIKAEFDMSFLDVNEHGVVIDSLVQTIRDDTGLVSVMCINNEIGSVNNIKKIGEICRKKNILFHTDCVQAAGAVSIDVDEIGCDFLSFSAHKIHGPKGIGALYVRNKENLNPIINGGLHQEFGLRGGTENIPNIVGFGKACEMMSNDIEKNAALLGHYKYIFKQTLRSKLNDLGLENDMRINGGSLCLGKTLSITFNNVDAEALVLTLDNRDVCISAGSACTSHESEPSHVLKAIGLSDDEARSTVRVSFSEYNTATEVERAAWLMGECVGFLRGVW